jgi:hypothetical protein
MSNGDGKAADYGLAVGETYQSRRGSRSPERTIIWISDDGRRLQYDGPAVRIGRHYPAVSADAFASWAGIEPQQE